jgi:AcrR family transcriptional regulator
MFHYHFKTRENFIRTLLGHVYEQMFSMLVLRAREDASPVQKLRNALLVLAQFGRKHRLLLQRIFGDALAGESVAVEFLQTNVPRHLAVLANLIGEAQRAGELVTVPLPQAVAFLAGSVMAPVLLGAAAIESGMLPATAGAIVERDVLSKKAVEQRIEFALRGLAGEARRTS